MFLFCLDKEKVYQVYHHILLVFLTRIKEKIPDTLKIRKQPIKEPVNPEKRSKENTLIHIETVILKETPP